MATIDTNKIKSGDLMAVIHYVKVKMVYPSTYEFLADDVDQDKRGLRVCGKDLLERLYSADQFAEEKKVGKLEAAETLINSINRPFTVAFEKADGQERVLRGRLIKPEPLLGRSMVEDLDAQSGNRVRQVDHRTIKWLIVDNIKYIVK